ncbi:MAG: hypothetical protein UZ17_ACD001002198 [Acidobacteria bacterium OLB17]|nr:MAG: hypothetical protein UZ17_ACD001002198 [Acidobacteria bacterium OLB17]
MDAEPRWWKIALMDLVDDFRYYKNPDAVAEPFELGDPAKDAVLAATIETLCDELGLEIPDWLESVPASPEPVFLSRVEALKAFSLVESPAHFRVRRVFVGENFLSRA